MHLNKMLTSFSIRLFYIIILLPYASLNAQEKYQSSLLNTPNEKRISKSAYVSDYLGEEHVIYRNYQNMFLKVEAMSDSIIIYSLKGKGYRGRTVYNYFFSRKLNTPVYLLDMHNIKTNFSKNESFLERVKKRYRWPLSLALIKNPYTPSNIIKLLNECALSENNFH